MRKYVLREIGPAKLQDLRRQDIQRLVDELTRLDISAATVRNALLLLRAICRRALSRGDIQFNPTTGIEIPAVRSRRTRFATPYEAHLLVEAAPAQHPVLWATAFYAGLRAVSCVRCADLTLTSRKVSSGWSGRGT